jgi:hypothetical protein
MANDATNTSASTDSIEDILDAQEEPTQPRPAPKDEPEPESPEGILDEEEDDDEFGAFDVPTDKLPKEEPKKEPEPEKKEEKKPEEKKADGDKPEEKSKAESQEKSKAPSAPPKLVKVKIGEKEHEIPEEVADHWEKVATRARELNENTKKLHESLFSGFGEKKAPGQFSGTVLDMLTEEMGGDREKAYESLLQEYASVLKREMDFRQLPEDRQARILAEEKAARLEAQVKAQEEARKAEGEKARQARFIEKAAEAVVGTMRGMGLALKPENREIYDRALRDLELAARQKKGLTPDAVAAIVKNAKSEVFAERDRRDAESKRRIEEIASLADEEFEKEAKKASALIERLRKWDAARLKEERAAKKADASKKEGEPEPKRSPAFTPKKTMNAAEWARTMG